MENTTAVAEDNTKVFGFWVYLMTDLVIFAVLFAAFIVLRDSTFGGPSSRDLFDMSTALTSTIILLTSSFTCSLGILNVHANKKNPALFWFGCTIALGLAFLSLEISEFSRFVRQGASWQRSAFLSSFFTLVGTHGLHISIGVLWMVVGMFHIWLRPLLAVNISRLVRMTLFWHFLDLVWIFIFTVVYGMGKLL